MTDYLFDGYFQRGGVVSPLSASSSNSILQDADPLIYYLLQYYTGVLALHLGPRWNVEVAAASRSDLLNLTVAEQVPFDPLPHFQEDQFKFPLLAVYRKEEKYEYLTRYWDHTICTLDVLWILPPLTAGQSERLTPFRAHATRTLVDRTLQGFDSFYNSGEQPWRESQIERIGVVGSKFGNIPDLNSDLYLPTVSLEIELVERRMPPPAGTYDSLSGVDNELDLTDPPNDPIDNFIDTDVNL